MKTENKKIEKKLQNINKNYKHINNTNTTLFTATEV